MYSISMRTMMRRWAFSAGRSWSRPAVIAAMIVAGLVASPGMAQEGWGDPAKQQEQDQDQDQTKPKRGEPRKKQIEPQVGAPATNRQAKIVEPFDAILADHDRLLTAVVDADGLIHYKLMVKGAQYHDLLQSLVTAYGATRVPEDDPDRKLAFLINAYNINVIDQVIKYERPKKVIDIEGFFDKLPIRVGQRRLTLDKLEHELIRPMGDPRIHAALNCAAISCPRMPLHPYHPKTLKDQLNAQARRWINDSRFNRVEDGQVKVSRLFDWFAEDFKVEPYDGRVGFILHFVNEGSPLGATLREAGDDAKLEFLEYDWSLNQAG